MLPHPMNFLERLIKCIVRRDGGPDSTHDAAATDARSAADDTVHRPDVLRALSVDDIPDVATSISEAAGTTSAGTSSSKASEAVHRLMMEEDERRERLFRRTAANSPPCDHPAARRHPRRTALQSATTHIGYQMARRATQQVYCCGACGAWLVRPQDLLNDVDRAASVALDDSSFTLCCTSADVRDAEAHDVETATGWRYAVCGVRCNSCDAFLGVKLRSIERRPRRWRANARHQMLDILSDFFCDSRGVRASPPNRLWLHSAAMAAVTQGEEGSHGDGDNEERDGGAHAHDGSENDEVLPWSGESDGNDDGEAEDRVLRPLQSQATPRSTPSPTEELAASASVGGIEDALLRELLTPEFIAASMPDAPLSPSPTLLADPAATEASGRASRDGAEAEGAGLATVEAEEAEGRGGRVDQEGERRGLVQTPRGADDDGDEEWRDAEEELEDEDEDDDDNDGDEGEAAVGAMSEEVPGQTEEQHSTPEHDGDDEHTTSLAFGTLDDALEGPGVDASPIAIGQIYLGARYLRLVDAQRHAPVADVIPLLCTKCDRTLSYTDQLLCTKRRWGFGRSPPEHACFMNSLVRSNIDVKSKYDEQLAQGLMEMADVFCKCGEQVGYAFCADKTPNQRNLNQVGRMGLVCSRFNVAPYQISHPSVLQS